MRSPTNLTLTFMLASILSTTAMPLSAAHNKVSQPEHVIGIVNPSQGMKRTTDGFISGMRDQGYIEGENTQFLRVDKKSEIQSAVTAMQKKGVELIYTVTTPGTKITQKIISGSGIAQVFTMYDPIKSEVIRSLTKPGKNMTGVQSRGSTSKALEWLLTAFPSTKEILVPISFDTHAAKQSLFDLQASANKLKAKLVITEVPTQQDLIAFLANLPDQNSAIFITHSMLINLNIDVIMAAALSHGIPVISSHKKEHATLSYGQDEFESGRQSAQLAHRLIQNGGSEIVPAEVAYFYLGINLKAANAIGADIPNKVLLHADSVIR